MITQNKKKSQSKSSNLSSQELLNLAKDYYTKLDFDKAEKFFLSAYERDPNNLQIIDDFSEFLISVGKEEEAEFVIIIQYLKKSIDLNPETNGIKYLNRAEMLQGKESLNYYQKGISLLTEEFHQNPNEEQNLRKKIAKAYSAIGELYMTDCWFVIKLVKWKMQSNYVKRL